MVSRLLITVNEEECCSSGICAMTAPDVFDQRDEDGVVKLLQTEPDEALYEKVLGAARKCPSKAIKVEKLTGDEAAEESGQ